MKKRISLFLTVLIFLSSVYGQEYKKQFIKGNISDKTTAVREASGQEGIWLSQKAIDFVKSLANKERNNNSNGYISRSQYMAKYHRDRLNQK